MRMHFIILIVGSLIFIPCFFHQVQSLGSTDAGNEGIILLAVWSIQRGLKVIAVYIVFAALTLGHAILQRRKNDVESVEP
jgi:hypothetical protein